MVQGEPGAGSLVIAGAKGWFYETIFARATELGLGDAVIFPGFVPAEELPWWYRAAELFVYPSLFEGFGLPVLEAMACGTPTITSNASSLPEVAGDAALLVEPEDTAGLAGAIARVLAEPAWPQLRAAGLRRLRASRGRAPPPKRPRSTRSAAVAGRRYGVKRMSAAGCLGSRWSPTCC